ncbi:DNA/RNA helicase domain-containing protein [Geomonas anaerohicana]|uniref:DUF2075 domain-containing protein n=1 Tax=Geomonas anaerohicana TaxID=2798583 RepID=A0ABS0YFA1_9BACT|nr:DNA/RNA helicase domain-containing protein [Geomonas anaerohicana]MBJ6750999.1 DUF2075 domain-containing protein [Geomonas anaerohicana]
MPAYIRKKIANFIDCSPAEIVGTLQQAYAADGFASQYTRQTQAWGTIIPALQSQLKQLIAERVEARDWALLLEYPLYRLRRRIDLVILAEDVIIVVECKVGAEKFSSEDCRQVEEYALDLRDFHALSHRRWIIPVLWSTEASQAASAGESYYIVQDATVAPVIRTGSKGLLPLLLGIKFSATGNNLIAEEWDHSAYRPVPNVIEAATTIFAGHGVQNIAKADADNLSVAAARLVELIQEAHEQKKRYLLFLTGVPGSGKTLAGLHVVHDSVTTGVESQGDIVYLSGNTPLVVVLREALARDRFYRQRRNGEERITLEQIRRDVRARIQHINDFLHESLRGTPDAPPHEHVIVFDEAQRAWDEKQGQEKFERTASEPVLLLELMSRHLDWCVCVCLVGGGQEINSGEEGVFGWGEAVRRLAPALREKWAIFAPPDVLAGGPSAGAFTLGDIPSEIQLQVEAGLQLRVPQRSYRSSNVSRWVNSVLSGNCDEASAIAQHLGKYPVMVTRSLTEAKAWLRQQGRGERRYGLLASSGARRLRADGLGTSLHASAGSEIAQWYLNRHGDIRSSFALEVPANEYTCQGLELDLACICWGGDMLWDAKIETWRYSRLSGTSWQQVREPKARHFLENSYRVLLTRAREGMILWVPVGDESDSTRPPRGTRRNSRLPNPMRSLSTVSVQGSRARLQPIRCGGRGSGGVPGWNRYA